jgi:hypothetical protein
MPPFPGELRLGAFVLCYFLQAHHAALFCKTCDCGCCRPRTSALLQPYMCQPLWPHVLRECAGCLSATESHTIIYTPDITPLASLQPTYVLFAVCGRRCCRLVHAGCVYVRTTPIRIPCRNCTYLLCRFVVLQALLARAWLTCTCVYRRMYPF